MLDEQRGSQQFFPQKIFARAYRSINDVANPKRYGVRYMNTFLMHDEKIVRHQDARRPRDVYTQTQVCRDHTLVIPGSRLAFRRASKHSNLILYCYNHFLAHPAGVYCADLFPCYYTHDLMICCYESSRVRRADVKVKIHGVSLCQEEGQKLTQNRSNRETR